MDGCLKCGPAALQRILRRTPLCQKSESPCEPVALKSKQCTNVLALSSLLSPSFPRPFTQTHLSNTYTYNSAPTTTRRGREYRRVCHGRESRRVIVAMLTVGALVLVRLGGGWGGGGAGAPRRMSGGVILKHTHPLLAHIPCSHPSLANSR